MGDPKAYQKTIGVNLVWIDLRERERERERALELSEVKTFSCFR